MRVPCLIRGAELNHDYPSVSFDMNNDYPSLSHDMNRDYLSLSHDMNHDYLSISYDIPISQTTCLTFVALDGKGPFPLVL